MAEAIEIKATIPGHHVPAALRRFKLSQADKQQRFIYSSTRRSSICWAWASSRGLGAWSARSTTAR